MSARLVESIAKVDLIDPLCGSEWDRLVLTHPQTTFFHSSAWARALSQTYGHTPVYLRITRDSELVALVPVMEVRSALTGCRGVCLPFTDVCEPLLFADGTFEIVCDQLRIFGQKQKWKYFEIRGGMAGESARPSVAFYSHVLDLQAGAQRVFAGFDSSVRRAIRKSERSGLTVEITRTREAVLQFYRLHTQTRRRHGAPPQPMAFFFNIYREIIEPGLGFVVLARHGTQPAAAAIFFQFAGKAIYKFGASDESLQEHRGNNLVMSEGIRYLAENHSETLHFGRTSLFNDGLRRFKQSWGAVEEKIQYFKFNPIAETWMTSRDKASGFHTALFARLPVTLNRLAGSLLYPHLD